jgi:hypothetical protein
MRQSLTFVCVRCHNLLSWVGPPAPRCLACGTPEPMVVLTSASPPQPQAVER